MIVYSLYFHVTPAQFEMHIGAARCGLPTAARVLPDGAAETLADAIEAAKHAQRPTTVLERDVLVASWAPDEGARYYAGRAP